MIKSIYFVNEIVTFLDFLSRITVLKHTFEFICQSSTEI